MFRNRNWDSDCIAFGRGWVLAEEGQASEVRAAFCIFIRVVVTH